MTLLYEGREWDFDKLKRAYDAIETIAREEMGLDGYPTQVEVITSEQMLESYSSIGLPLLYRHWSFGKRFARDEALYRKGHQGLAYEIVINSDPCICYIMEENSMTMQTLVMAHAAFGHNHFFKNNHLFRQWTDASGILDYLAFARDFVARCEEKEGIETVEAVLDAAHALQIQGVNRYRRRHRRSFAEEMARARERQSYLESTWNPLWTTVPGDKQGIAGNTRIFPPSEKDRGPKELPEENILYFLEKNSPALKGWEREIVRIVRILAQYFYPQRQTRMMNEGCATFVHYEIMTRLHEKGLIDDGAFLEFLHAHSAVIAQPDFDDPRYGGINPYALGFAMMSDIKRVTTDPTDEDKKWLPDIAGNGDAMGTLRHIWSEFRDESFILQYLSPKLVRDFHLFRLRDRTGTPYYEITAIHDERGFRDVRAALAEEHEIARLDPEIEVTAADLRGDRKLVLEHHVHDGRRLDPASMKQTLRHVRRLWGYPVTLRETEALGGELLPEGETEVA